MIKILGILSGSLLLGAAVAAAIVMGVVPVPFGPAAEARAVMEKNKPPVTVMYPTKEQVVNLSDKSGNKYLKTAVTLEFIDTKYKDPPQGAAVAQQQTDFATDVSPQSAIIQDALVKTLSSKTSADLLKPDGKDQLKTDLINNINQSLHGDPRAVGVYFTTFIIQ
jgi:flagellar basal body-associated protein FliL